MRMSNLEPPFRMRGELMAEQDPFDRLDLGRQMLILQPEADRAVAHSDSCRKLLGAPPPAGTISRRTRAGAAQQMPTEELPEALSRAVRPPRPWGFSHRVGFPLVSNHAQIISGRLS
jgi:hypothetical protein